LIIPTAFTINAAGKVALCPVATGLSPLGLTCANATWGANVDIQVNNTSLTVAFMNVLMDWDQDGSWGGVSTCVTGAPVPEHVLVNFPVPGGYVGPLSGLAPPPFTIGPIPGFVWTRFTISESPVPANWGGSGSFQDGETEDYLLFIQARPPVVVAAESVRTHGPAGTFGIALNISGVGNATTEPRIDTVAGSNPMVVLTYDVALSPAPADLPTVTATATGGPPPNPPTVGIPVVVGNKLQIPLTGSTDKTCVTLTITGVKAPYSATAAPHMVKLTYRKGDVDNTRSVGPADINAVKAHSSIVLVNVANFWYDLDCSGRTGPSDITLVKSLSALGTTACALP